MALIGLSDRTPDRFIADALAESLNKETRDHVLVIHLVVRAAPAMLRDWDTQRLNGEFAFAGDVEILKPGVARVDLGVSGDPAEALGLATVARHCLEHYTYVLLHAEVECPFPVVAECLRNAQRSFVLLQADARDLYHRDLLNRQLENEEQAVGVSRPSTIICRERAEAQSSETLRHLGPSVHGLIHGCPTASVARNLVRWPDRTFAADVRRIAREISRRRVGLALSSGGARGLAHIGVIQVLEENGVDIDYVAGCSMGSYVGAVWAFGLDGVEMERLAREVEHRWGLLELIDPFVLPRQGFLRGEKIKRRLKRSIGEIHFEELIRPLRVVATNLTTLERVVFASGEVASAVHASSAIPGACVPVKLGEELYIDGGIADPLPVDVLEEMGIERIIAVNTIPTPEYLRRRHEMEKEHQVRRSRRARSVKLVLNQYFNYFAPGNVLDTILRSFNGAQMRVAEESARHAHLVLRPVSYDGRWHDFRRPGKYIAIGRREAEEHLQEIIELINHKEPNYEPRAACNTVAGPA
ncbi:MAG TPA: patatin-like phospholipase family protein [Methylomirabilota bacterium]|nr:patatin-like phospholipase family protein [Methylomirabilota bacterium]